MSPALQTLKINIDKAKAKMPEAIRQAYCIVVTVSDKDEAQAFKISVGRRGALRDHQEGPPLAGPGYGDHGRCTASQRPVQPVEGWRNQSASEGPGRGFCPASAPAEDAQVAGYRRDAGRGVHPRYIRAQTDAARPYLPHLVADSAGRRSLGRPGVGVGLARGGRAGRHSRRFAGTQGPAQPLDRGADYRPGRARLLQWHDRGAGGQGRFPGARARAQGIGRRGEHRDRRGCPGRQGLAAFRPRQPPGRTDPCRRFDADIDAMRPAAR